LNGFDIKKSNILSANHKGLSLIIKPNTHTVDIIESLKSIGGFIYRFKFLLAFVTIFTLGLISYLYFSPDAIKNLGASVNDAESVDIGHFPIVKPTIKYGFALDTFQVYEGQIKTGDYFGAILNRYNIDHIKITRLAEASNLFLMLIPSARINPTPSWPKTAHKKQIISYMSRMFIAISFLIWTVLRLLR